MSNLREVYAATAMAGLGWNPDQEKAIDRVAAAGKANALGLLLWKAKYMLESAAYSQARKELLVIYGKRYRDNLTVATAMIEQALREYLAPACRACRGVGEMMANERRIVCESCGGSKIHRYSNSERARTMQISFGIVRVGQHKLQWLLGELNTADKIVNTAMAYELERER